MADLSKIILPNGSTYDIKDSVARSAIVSAVKFKGVSSVSLSDGGTENPVINGNAVTVKNTGDMYFYGVKEFIWGDDNKWHLLGSDNGGLGGLAYASSAKGFTYYTPSGTVSQPTFSGAQLTSTVSYTPEGTVSTPTISIASAGATTTVNNPTARTVVQSIVAGTAANNKITYSTVSGDGTLYLYPIGYATTESISTANVTVKTGDASYNASTIGFTGSAATLSSKGTPTGTVSQPIFSGTEATITVTSTAV